MKYEEWEDEADIASIKQKRYKIKGDRWLVVDYAFHMPIYNKNGSIRKVDAENYIKTTSDWLASRIEGFDDSKILEYKIRKVESKIRKVEILVCEI